MYDPNDPTGGSHPPGGGCDSSTSSPDWSTEPTRLGGNDAEFPDDDSPIRPADLYLLIFGVPNLGQPKWVRKQMYASLRFIATMPAVLTSIFIYTTIFIHVFPNRSQFMQRFERMIEGPPANYFLAIIAVILAFGGIRLTAQLVWHTGTFLCLGYGHYAATILFPGFAAALMVANVAFNGPFTSRNFVPPIVIALGTTTVLIQCWRLPFNHQRLRQYSRQ